MNTKVKSRIGEANKENVNSEMRGNYENLERPRKYGCEKDGRS